MTTRVSIIIPVYNAAPWLADTLKSALMQSHQNLEILVVDDGSSDESVNIAKSFSDPRIRFFCQANQGASSARNHGLAKCTGDFIQYLDADDLLAPEKIERQLDLAQHFPDSKNFLFACPWGRFENSIETAKVLHDPLWFDFDPISWCVCAWGGNLMMHPAAWLVPRELEQAAGPWNEALSLNDDGEYFFRLILKSKGIHFCHGTTSYYRSYLKQSLSGSTSISAYQSWLESLELSAKYLLAAETSARTRSACSRTFQRFLYHVYPSCPELQRKASRKIAELGDSKEPYPGGLLTQILSTAIGWKATKKLQGRKAKMLQR